MSHEELACNAILYTYPGGEYDIIATTGAWIPEGWEDSGKWGRDTPAPTPREKGKRSEGEDKQRSCRRARAQLRRLALSNNFQYFVTLTLDQTRIDRYDGAAIVKALNQWCDNMVRRNGLRYVLVPELHEDGAFHFHGFFAGDGLQIVDSGTIKRPGIKKPRRPADETERQLWLEEGGHIVYNLPQWTLGFSTALVLYGTYSRAVGYCCKYIGKQDGERPLGRWYYSGGRLEKPTKEYAVMDYRGLKEDFAGAAVELDIPGSKILVIHN